jgi:putative SOS response-associated peptidase YedK
MCGRFTLTRRDRRELAALLGVDEKDLRDYQPHYNIAPLQDHLVIRSKYERRELLPARWGLVNSWAANTSSAASCINAKAETIETRPSFKDAFAKRRCLVPADGFYEWRGRKDNREPLWIHSADDGLLWLAGLYESWQPKPGHWQRTFTIITTRANRLIEPIHDRMPVIFNERAAEDWMNPGERDPLRLKSLLVPAPDDNLVLSPASSLVNNVKNDGPELLIPGRAIPESGQRDGSRT